MAQENSGVPTAEEFLDSLFREDPGPSPEGSPDAPRSPVLGEQPGGQASPQGAGIPTLEDFLDSLPEKQMPLPRPEGSGVRVPRGTDPLGGVPLFPEDASTPVAFPQEPYTIFDYLNEEGPRRAHEAVTRLERGIGRYLVAPAHRFESTVYDLLEQNLRPLAPGMAETMAGLEKRSDLRADSAARKAEAMFEGADISLSDVAETLKSEATLGQKAAAISGWGLGTVLDQLPLTMALMLSGAGAAKLLQASPKLAFLFGGTIPGTVVNTGFTVEEYEEITGKKPPPAQAIFWGAVQGAIETAGEVFALGPIIEQAFSRAGVKATKEMVEEVVPGIIQIGKAMGKSAVGEPVEELAQKFVSGGFAGREFDEKFWREAMEEMLSAAVAGGVTGGAAAAFLQNVADKKPTTADEFYDLFLAMERPITREEADQLAKDYKEEKLDLQTPFDWLLQQHPEGRRVLSAQVEDFPPDWQGVLRRAARPTPTRLAPTRLFAKPTEQTPPEGEQAVSEGGQEVLPEIPAEEEWLHTDNPPYTIGEGSFGAKKSPKRKILKKLARAKQGFLPRGDIRLAGVNVEEVNSALESLWRDGLIDSLGEEGSAFRVSDEAEAYFTAHNKKEFLPPTPLQPGEARARQTKNYSNSEWLWKQVIAEGGIRKSPSSIEIMRSYDWGKSRLGRGMTSVFSDDPSSSTLDEIANSLAERGIIRVPENMSADSHLVDLLNQELLHGRPMSALSTERELEEKIRLEEEAYYEAQREERELVDEAEFLAEEVLEEEIDESEVLEDEELEAGAETFDPRAFSQVVYGRKEKAKAEPVDSYGRWVQTTFMRNRRFESNEQEDAELQRLKRNPLRRAMHRALVQEDIARGSGIVPENAKDYPDLAPGLNSLITGILAEEDATPAMKELAKEIRAINRKRQALARAHKLFREVAPKVALSPEQASFVEAFYGHTIPEGDPRLGKIRQSNLTQFLVEPTEQRRSILSQARAEREIEIEKMPMKPVRVIEMGDRIAHKLGALRAMESEKKARLARLLQWKAEELMRKFPATELVTEREIAERRRGEQGTLFGAEEAEIAAEGQRLEEERQREEAPARLFRQRQREERREQRRREQEEREGEEEVEAPDENVPEQEALEPLTSKSLADLGEGPPKIRGYDPQEKLFRQDPPTLFPPSDNQTQADLSDEGGQLSQGEKEVAPTVGNVLGATAILTPAMHKTVYERSSQYRIRSIGPVLTTGDVAALLSRARNNNTEHMWAVLKLKDGTIIVEHLAVGTLYATNALGVKRFQSALLHSGDVASFYIVHNHPGSPVEPSDADVKVNGMFAEDADLLGITYNGLVIINGEKYATVSAKGEVSTAILSEGARELMHEMGDPVLYAGAEQKLPDFKKQGRFDEEYISGTLKGIHVGPALTLLDGFGNVIGLYEFDKTLSWKDTFRTMARIVASTNPLAATITISGESYDALDRDYKEYVLEWGYMMGAAIENTMGVPVLHSLYLNPDKSMKILYEHRGMNDVKKSQLSVLPPEETFPRVFKAKTNHRDKHRRIQIKVKMLERDLIKAGVIKDEKTAKLLYQGKVGKASTKDMSVSEILQVYNYLLSEKGEIAVDHEAHGEQAAYMEKLKAAIDEMESNQRSVPRSQAGLRKALKTAWTKGLVAWGEYIRAQGPAGEEIYRITDEVLNRSARVAGGHTSRLLYDALSGVSPEEMHEAVDIMEGRKPEYDLATTNALDDSARRVQNLVDIARESLRFFASELQKRGVDLRANFFPHVTPPAEYIDQSEVTFDELVDNAMRIGAFEKREDAETILKHWVVSELEGTPHQKALEYIHHLKITGGKQLELSGRRRTPGGVVPFVPSKAIKPSEEDLMRARTIWDAMRKTRAIPTFGHALPRLINFPFYYSRPDLVLPEYFYGAAHYIEQVDAYGKEGEKAVKLAEQVDKEGGDYESALRFLKVAMGQRGQDARSTQAASTILAVQAITKLPMAQLRQTSQFIGQAWRTDIISTLKAARELYRGTAQINAIRAGATVGVAMRHAREEMYGLGNVWLGTGKWGRALAYPFLWIGYEPPGGGKPWNIFKGGFLSGTFRAERALQRTGFLFMDLKAREMGVAGGFYAEMLADKLLKNQGEGFRQRRNREFAERRLRELNVDPSEVLQNEGLTAEHRLKAIQKASYDVNFRASFMDLPEWKNSVWANVFFYQFKTFSLQQWRTIRKQVLGEFRRGNPTPLIWLLAFSAVAGEGVNDIIYFLKRLRWRDEKLFTRLVENVIYQGILGIVGDVLFTQGHKFGGTLGVAAAPALGDVADVVDSGLRTGMASLDYVVDPSGETQKKVVDSFRGPAYLVLHNVPFFGRPFYYQFVKKEGGTGGGRRFRSHSSRTRRFNRRSSRR